MAKLKNDAIKLEDMQEYLNSTSDFAFEMRVLKLLNANARTQETTFGGLYQDPNTNQTRQFDIRSRIRVHNDTVWLAIECKNLKDNFPLLISGSKRKYRESVINAWQCEQGALGNSFSISIDGHRITTQSLQPSQFYIAASFVGRSCAQVGRLENGSNKINKGTIESSDSEVYSKWSQALCSLHGLMQITLSDIKRQVIQQKVTPHFFAFIPIVVVPDGMLWIAEYSDNGELLEAPKQVANCSYLVNKQYAFPAMSCEYTVSHIEFMTFTGLMNFFGNKNPRANIFKKD